MKYISLTFKDLLDILFYNKENITVCGKGVAILIMELQQRNHGNKLLVESIKIIFYL